jgi:hypothetical protein
MQLYAAYLHVLAELMMHGVMIIIYTNQERAMARGGDERRARKPLPTLWMSRVQTAEKEWLWNFSESIIEISMLDECWNLVV